MAAHSEYLAGLTLEDRTALESRLLERQSAKCFICDDTIDPVLHQDQLDVDHIVPLAEQGADDEHNFALTHASCNRSKGASDLRVARRMAEFEKLQQQALELANAERTWTRACRAWRGQGCYSTPEFGWPDRVHSVGHR